MKTLAILTVAITMMLAVRPSPAGEIAYSSRAALLRKQAAISRKTTSYIQTASPAMACALCKNVSVLVKHPVGTKPGFRLVESRVSIHQCASCSDKMVTQLNQTRLVHTCAAGGEMRPDGCVPAAA